MYGAGTVADVRDGVPASPIDVLAVGAGPPLLVPPLREMPMWALPLLLLAQLPERLDGHCTIPAPGARHGDRLGWQRCNTSSLVKHSAHDPRIPGVVVVAARLRPLAHAGELAGVTSRRAAAMETGLHHGTTLWRSKAPPGSASVVAMPASVRNRAAGWIFPVGKTTCGRLDFGSVAAELGNYFPFEARYSG